MSMTLQIFSAKTSDSDPPKIVKSWEKTQTGRPKTVPYPVMTASPSGRLSRISNSTSRCRTKRSSSTNDPGSSSRSRRSRASSFPLSRCRATAFSVAAWAACSPSSWSLRSLPSVVSASPVMSRSLTPCECGRGACLRQPSRQAGRPGAAPQCGHGTSRSWSSGCARASDSRRGRCRTSASNPTPIRSCRGATTRSRR